MGDLPRNSRAAELEGYTTKTRKNPPVRDLERDWSRTQREEKQSSNSIDTAEITPDLLPRQPDLDRRTPMPSPTSATRTKTERMEIHEGDRERKKHRGGSPATALGTAAATGTNRSGF